jgi:uncharacterized membrane protein
VAKHELTEYQKLVSFQDKVADAITSFSGSMLFVYLHALIFGLWIVLNSAVGQNWFSFLPHNFDPFPFGLLTMAVSLEAIFLATFVLISQNRQSERADLRAELDYQVNVHSEKEIEAIQTKLEEIIVKLNKK